MAGKASTLCAALCAAIVATAGYAQVRGDRPPGMLVVLAHPDDELVLAPAIARSIREGGPLTILFATSGDAGPGVSEMERGENLARVREDEARCSIATLGGGDVRFLRLGDGTLATNAHHPGSAARKLADAVDEALDEKKFATVLTWGPDGGYGHPDHRLVNAVVTERVQAMGDDRPVLLYPGIEAGTLPDIPQMQGWAVTAGDLLPISYAYNDTDLARVRDAANCHASQFSAEDRAALPALFDQTIWRGSVHFRPAFVTAEPVEGPTRD